MSLAVTFQKRSRGEIELFVQREEGSIFGITNIAFKDSKPKKSMECFRNREKKRVAEVKRKM